jgi:two-component system chemotaxis response regulator CheY
MKILIADDEDACRALLQDMFAADTAVKLAMARDGAEAWWHLTEPNQRFDLCILDLKMPVVDGLKLIERIRTTPNLRHLPIILCTGINDRDTVGKALRLAITHYVVKPYKPESMREKIRSAVPHFARVDRPLMSA